jgi:pyruvate formate lyase activating enzyme
MRVDEVMAEILPWRAFLRGITISGGECLLQPKCTTALLEAARQAGLPGLVDTNGSTQLSSLPQLVLAAAGFMLDIKAWDQNEHRALTGMDNEVVLANLDFLIPTGKLLEVRTVVTEGLFDSRQTVREVSRRIALAPNPVCYRIIAFRPEGVRSRGKKLCHPPAAEEMETLRTIALSEGVRQVALIASDSFSPPSPITS